MRHQNGQIQYSTRVLFEVFNMGVRVWPTEDWMKTKWGLNVIWPKHKGFAMSCLIDWYNLINKACFVFPKYRDLWIGKESEWMIKQVMFVFCNLRDVEWQGMNGKGHTSWYSSPWQCWLTNGLHPNGSYIQRAYTTLDLSLPNKNWTIGRPHKSSQSKQMTSCSSALATHDIGRTVTEKPAQLAYFDKFPFFWLICSYHCSWYHDILVFSMLSRNSCLKTPIPHVY